MNKNKVREFAEDFAAEYPWFGDTDHDYRVERLADEILCLVDEVEEEFLQSPPGEEAVSTSVNLLCLKEFEDGKFYAVVADEADAHLMAGAQDLLSALKQIREITDMAGEGSACWMNRLAEVARIASAAIAKTTGDGNV